MSYNGLHYTMDVSGAKVPIVRVKVTGTPMGSTSDQYIGQKGDVADVLCIGVDNTVVYLVFLDRRNVHGDRARLWFHESDVRVMTPHPGGPYVHEAR